MMAAQTICAVLAGVFLLFSQVGRGVDQEPSCEARLEAEAADFVPGVSGEQFVLVPDPYSAGALLAPALRRRGFKPLYIRSNSQDPALFRTSGWHPSDFDGGVDIQNADWLDLTRKLDVIVGQGKVVGSIAGTDVGSPLMDFLNDHYSISGNPLRSTRLRRNKFWMGEAVKESGLSPRQMIAKKPADAVDWVENVYGKWPVIAKPTESAGTDDIYLCQDQTQLAAAVSSILGKENVIGGVNREVLVQEVLPGDKYIVEVVSAGGKHRVAFIWKYDYVEVDRKAYVFKKVDLMAPYGQIQDQLVYTAFTFLDAIEHTTGVAHVEMDAHNGKISVFDYGSRLGGGLPEICNTATNRDVVEMTLDAHLDPQKLLRLPERYDRVHPAIIVGVNNFNRSPHFIDHRRADWYKNADNTLSFFSFKPRYVHNSLVPMTEDLNTTPARMEFVGASAEADYRTFVEREADPATAIIREARFLPSLGN